MSVRRSVIFCKRPPAAASRVGYPILFIVNNIIYVYNRSLDPTLFASFVLNHVCLACFGCYLCHFMFIPRYKNKYHRNTYNRCALVQRSPFIAIGQRTDKLPTIGPILQSTFILKILNIVPPQSNVNAYNSSHT